MTNIITLKEKINSYYDQNKYMYIDNHRNGAELAASLNDYFDITGKLPKRFIECLLKNKFRDTRKGEPADIYIKEMLFDGVLSDDDWDYSKICIISVCGRCYKIHAKFNNEAYRDRQNNGEIHYKLLGLSELEVKRVKPVIQKSIVYVEE